MLFSRPWGRPGPGLWVSAWYFLPIRPLLPGRTTATGSAEYLFGAGAVLPYRIIYTVLVVVGAYIPLKLVWNFADIANILMAVPNLISLILLAGVVKGLSKDYFDRMSSGSGQVK